MKINNLKAVIYGKSDPGRVRNKNQDRIFFDNKFQLGVVCDGIGGRNSGEIAAQMIIDDLEKSFNNNFENIKLDPEISITDILNKTNENVFNTANEDISYNGMGSTVNMIFLNNNYIFIGHVGDTRTYLFFNNSIWQLTIDHNISFLIRKHLISENSPLIENKKALIKAIGITQDTQIDVYKIKAACEMLFLTCSDGLTDMVNEKEILNIIKKYRKNMDDTINNLISAANDNGGKDNISIVLTKIIS